MKNYHIFLPFFRLWISFSHRPYRTYRDLTGQLMEYNYKKTFLSLAWPYINGLFWSSFFWSTLDFLLCNDQECGFKEQNKSLWGADTLVILQNTNVISVMGMWVLGVGAGVKRYDWLVASCIILLLCGFYFFICYL